MSPARQPPRWLRALPALRAVTEWAPLVFVLIGMAAALVVAVTGRPSFGFGPFLGFLIAGVYIAVRRRQRRRFENDGKV